MTVQRKEEERGEPREPFFAQKQQESIIKYDVLFSGVTHQHITRVVELTAEGHFSSSIESLLSQIYILNSFSSFYSSFQHTVFF